MSDPVKLTIEFPSQDALEHFALWLNGSGEQSYWKWMMYREQEEPERDIRVRFEYYFSGGLQKGSDIPSPEEFLGGTHTIRTTSQPNPYRQA